MIITDEFIVLNLPKTGSTYVRAAIRRAHRKRAGIARHLALKLRLVRTPTFVERLLPHIDETNNPTVRDQHGTFRQIPVEHRNKKILTVVRNPLDRFVSAYHFGWWKTHPPGDKSAIREVYPHFPDLSFEEFFELFDTFGSADRLQGVQTKSKIGIQTIQFVQFFFLDPISVLRQMDEEWIDSGAYQKLLPEITFLRQECLNEELFRFLRKNGYEDVNLDFVLQDERVNVTTRGESPFESKQHYSESLLEKILDRERFLFRLFPDYLPEVSVQDR